jgi:hypothetical protein
MVRRKMRSLIIEEPRLWFAYSDEKNFFRWLESTPSVGKVVRVDRGLELQLKEPVDDESLRDLIALLTRYDLDRSVLAVLATAKNRSWFKNKKSFWYNSVFHKAKKRPRSRPSVSAK